MIDDIDETASANEPNLLLARLSDVCLLVRFACHELASPMGIVGTALSFLLESCRHIQQKLESETLNQEDLKDFLAQLETGLAMATKNNQVEAEVLSRFRSMVVPQCIERCKTVLLSSIFDDVIHALRARFKQFPQQLHVSCPATLEVQTKIGALSNVLFNLLDYVHSFVFEITGHGDIWLSAKRDGDCLIIEIVHNGGNDITRQDDLNELKPDSAEVGVRMSMSLVETRILTELHGELNLGANKEGNHLILLRIPDQTDRSEKPTESH